MLFVFFMKFSCSHTDLYACIRCFSNALSTPYLLWLLVHGQAVFLAWRKGWGLFDCTFRHPPLFYRFTRRFGGGNEEVGLTVNVTGGLIGGFWQEAQI